MNSLTSACSNQAPSMHRLRLIRLAIVLSTFTALALLSACATSNPGAGAAQRSSAEGRSYNEPAISGVVIDQNTKRPIQGALVYGHYLTTGGTLAGGTVPAELLKSFEVETDAQGRFTLPAWNTGERKVVGAAQDRFPMIAVWKPGYALELQGLDSITRFSPRSTEGMSPEQANSDDFSVPITRPPQTEAVYADPTAILAPLDFTKRPFELRPISDELKRFNALRNSGVAMMSSGPCGWERYSKVLLAQHVEMINMKRRLIPANRRGVDDMPKDAYPLGTSNRTGDGVFIEEILIQKAPLHRLRDSYVKSGADWRCKDPRPLFEQANSKIIQDR
jgi:hypothetical protein